MSVVIVMSGYGHFPGGDPRDFTPDAEVCTPMEIAAHAEAVASGERHMLHGQWCERSSFGLGTYETESEEQAAWWWALGHNLAVAGALADGPAKMERVLREAGGVLLSVASVVPMRDRLSILHGVAIRLLEPGHPTVRDIWRAKHWAEWMEAWGREERR